MNVELPTSGCNIISSSTSFYNYHDDGHTRDNYIIYDGKAILSATSSSQYGYSYTGTCLSTGDLVYKPEYKEFIMPFASIIASLTIFIIAYRLVVRSLMP